MFYSSQAASARTQSWWTYSLVHDLCLGLVHRIKGTLGNNDAVVIAQINGALIIIRGQFGFIRMILDELCLFARLLVAGLDAWSSHEVVCGEVLQAV